ncbi:hypothetical protein APSETT444_002314 [Aspergillus pseudonomiae]
MRPPVPDVALRRARKASIEQQWIDPRNTAPATFFLARSRDHDADEELSPDESVPSRDSMYGVQSLEEAVHDVNLSGSECEPYLSGGNHDSTTPIGQQQQPQPPPHDHLDNGLNGATSLPRRKSTLKPSDLLNASRFEISLPSSDRTSPRPLTPSNLSNPDDPSFSLPSSPKSFSNQSLRHLDDISITDDASSEVVASGEEDNDFPTPFNLLRAMTSLNSANHDFQNMLAGNGGAQVDAVLYLISEDIESIRKLCDWTNVIPVVSKSDLLSSSRVSALKSTFHKQAQEANIKLFLFGDASLGKVDGLSAQCPFAVSSAKSDDDDVMDASTLMSPDYAQPLMASELMLLVQMLFDRENIAWMRHLSAKKLALRQQEQFYWQQDNLPNGALPDVHTLRGGPSSYTMARISDYTRHEERLARVQLAKWASDLQQSLRNERERYATIARGDRAVWLTERLGECVIDGSLVPISQTPGFCGLRVPVEQAGGGLLVRTQNGKMVECRIARISPHDPLGLVWWSEDLKRRGWTIIQIVGSFGVVGGLALWLAKAWGLSSRSFSDWRFDWYCTGH